MKGNYVWLLDADSALEFYDRCLRKEAITETEKNEVMVQMYREGLIDCLGHTTMSKNELVAALAKEMRVLNIGPHNEIETE